MSRIVFYLGLISLSMCVFVDSATTMPQKKKKRPEEFVPPSKPDYNDLETWEQSTISTQPEFIQACKEMAGYYKDPTKNPALSKTIMMGGINYSYRDFYHNFKCYTDRLGIKFLPISLDQSIYTYITKNQVSLCCVLFKLFVADILFAIRLPVSELLHSQCLTYRIETK